ncbi:tyrosine-type recombinase/integrase [Aquabacterium sp. A7-Y]|uniref:tyrosine-type recombinase/integrase n=1 Tax=Aquabacterium sp. A7-Y TaxID=1349605 RepID=UPI00223E7DA2|nr:tyrosine-type recombinase/integrase [Aquabacterium sp. A7-Y]MCW7541661.1 tyrosine-type recombinase/integrase [Aquabacterium sp. A7-Y]
MRITEIARLQVNDVLMPSGELRREISLRAAITKGSRQRCVFLTNTATIEAVERYSEHRWTKNWGTELDRRMFRGLSLATALILSHKGAAFELTRKSKRLAGGDVEDYWACDSLQARTSQLYRAAGLHECSSHTGRRTFATRLLQQGHDI